MDRLKQAAILTRLTQSLRDKGSWAGETHIQKAAFVLQQLLKVPLGFDFILYRHGPFSFDFGDELTALQADWLLVAEPQPVPYGSKLAVTEHARRLQGLHPKTLGKYGARIQFVADRLAGMGVGALERLATAIYVTQELGADSSVDQRAKRLHEYKPHINPSSAARAVREADELAAEAASLIASEQLQAQGSTA
jgi:hypothetical protein